MRNGERCIIQHTEVYPAYLCEKPKKCPPYPLMCPSFIQLWDRNYINEITEVDTPLNLSNLGINPIFTTGGFSLETTTIPNDTLKFPEIGLYHVEISLKASYRINSYYGEGYQILFKIEDTNNENLGSLIYSGIEPYWNYAELKNALTTEFLLSITDISVGLRVILESFNFNIVSDNKLDVSDIIIIVKKWYR